MNLLLFFSVFAVANAICFFSGWIRFCAMEKRLPSRRGGERLRRLRGIEYDGAGRLVIRKRVLGGKLVRQHCKIGIRCVMPFTAAAQDTFPEHAFRSLQRSDDEWHAELARQVLHETALPAPEESGIENQGVAGGDDFPGALRKMPVYELRGIRGIDAGRSEERRVGKE